ncbi:MAG: hypothetical protein HYV17_13395 [Xanthomonadales bacterium]|nr:hypothetical protein [Xanthomonadales bacterium]
MQRFRPAWFLLVALAPVLGGCSRHSGDEPEFPALISDKVCPDLSGSFAMQPDPGSQGGWSNTSYTHSLQAPATVVSLFDSGGYSMTTVFHRDPAEFAAAVERFRSERPAEHARWRQQALSMFDPMRGALKVRRELPFEALTRLGPVPEWGAVGSKGHCRDGWWVEDGDYDTETAMTRDVRGGLLVRFDKTERKMISLWAETGAGIPYAIHTHSRWSRFAPAQVPPFWMPTADKLPPSAAAVASEDPDGWLQRGEDARVTTLRSRARNLMGADSMLLNFKLDGDHVLFTGTLPERAALDRLVAALGQETGVARVQLESTMDMSFGRVRFVIYLYWKR